MNMEITVDLSWSWAGRWFNGPSGKLWKSGWGIAGWDRLVLPHGGNLQKQAQCLAYSMHLINGCYYTTCTLLFFKTFFILEIPDNINVSRYENANEFMVAGTISMGAGMVGIHSPPNSQGPANYPAHSKCLINIYWLNIWINKIKPKPLISAEI